MDKALQYIDDVMSGRIRAGHYIKKVLARHVDDLKRSKEKSFPYYFDYSKAEHVLHCFSLLKLPTSNGANTPFILMPYQACILYLAYGWRKKKNHAKRFRRVYLKVARGNAKTEFLVGVGTYGFVFEGGDNPEVFWVATKRDQAKIGWKRQVTMMKRLVQDEPALEGLFGFHTSEIFKRGELSWVKYLGKDSKSEDGWKPSYALADEYHAHVDDGMINVMESGFVKRDDPMLWIITTAGYNPQGPNSEFLRRCKQMLDGALPGENVLPFIYELDEVDDWRDPQNWIKANPGLDHVLTIDGLMEEYKKIDIGGTSKEIDFKVKNLNFEQNSREAWIDFEAWRKCGEPINDDALKGRECYAGIDLSLTRDITALALFFPRRNEQERHILRVFFWMPEENPEIMAQNGIPYADWIEQGWITATDGDVIDHDELAADMLNILKNYKTKRVDIDPFAMLRVALNFSKAGLTLNEVTQNVSRLSQPTQELERMVIGQELQHGDNPVLNWMVSNCDVYRDSNDNTRVIKSEYKKKIDGIAASVNALFGYLQVVSNLKKQSYIFQKGAKLEVF